MITAICGGSERIICRRREKAQSQEGENLGGAARVDDRILICLCP